MKLNLDRWGETILGAIVAAVAIGFFTFAATQAGASGPAQGSRDLRASFLRADGVSVGSDVRVSGVKVGVVRSMRLNPESYRAELTLAVDSAVIVPDNSTAQIKQDGLLGGSFVDIEPSGETPLNPGEEIPNTNGSVDLLTVMSQAMQGMNSGGANSNSSQDTP